MKKSGDTGERSGVVKVCLVGECTSSSQKKPNKRFLAMPNNPERRSAWLIACGKEPSSVSNTTRLYVCENHFNFEEDTYNYMQFKYFTGKRVFLKSHVVPHIFNVPESEQSSSEDESSSSEVCTEESENYECQQSSFTSDGEGELVSEGDDSKEYSDNNETHAQSHPSLSEVPSPESQHSIEEFSETSCHDSENRQESCSPIEVLEPPLTISPEMSAVEALFLLSKDVPRSCKDQQTQTHITVKEKSVMARPYHRSKSTQCSLSKETRDTGTSPIRELESGKVSGKKVSFFLQESPFSSPTLKQSTSSPADSFDFSSPGSVFPSGSSGEYKTTGSDEMSDYGEHERFVAKRNMTNTMCLQDPMYHLGLPVSSMSLITTLSECTKSDPLLVMICLKKIRLNQAFKGLGYDFGFSESHVTKIFGTMVPKLAQCLSSLVLWPSSQKIRKRLPVAFRARYSNVQSIIDCFEIEIEKPSDPVKQTLTWSNYKQCNTLKYLISCTPDGYINFVSKGFGGRASDIKITEMSGYLDVVPKNAGVMADRGFKGIAKHLEKLSCFLIRPPSVAAGEKSTEEEVMLTKRIASLRIHIERVIRRVREFDMLKPHSCVHHSLLKYMDMIVNIVCGLVNLQEPLIKKYV